MRAAVHFILVTDCQTDRRESIDEIAGRIHKRKITVVVHADPARKEVYAPLVREGGRFFAFGEEESKTDNSEVLASLSGATVVLGKRSFDPERDVVLHGMKGLYARRTAPHRAQWIGKYGGTLESETAVADGLNWLAATRPRMATGGRIAFGASDEQPVRTEDRL